MTSKYFVQIAGAEIYFDVNRKPCRLGAKKTTYFVRFDGEASLIQAEWDMALARFTREERACAQLWDRCNK